MPSDVTAVDAVLSFDVPTRTAWGHARVAFTGDGPPALDLRQPHSGDLTDVEYQIGTPSAEGALPLGWTAGRPGVIFDFWMSDLAPGRYLESWIPAPPIGDQFALTISLEGLRGHEILANGEVDGNVVRYPDHYTALSPMLVVAPEERIEALAGDGVVAWKLAGPEIDLVGAHAQAVEFLAADAERFGPYCHRSPFVLYLWGTTRGMEYDGGACSSVGALEHEVLHSWFGRGLKPAAAADGWIDEAFVTWYTAGPPRRKQFAAAFDWDEPPVLLCPPDHTPREAYVEGARFFAGLADLLTVDGLIGTMAAWYAQGAPRLVTTAELQAHLSAAAGRDLTPEFARWVYGRP